MLKLIADSGSSKTDWALVQQGKIIRSFQTVGLNPYLNTKDMIVEVLRNEVLSCFSTSEIKNTSRIDFYGAGCSSVEKSKLIEDIIRCFFPFATVTVSHDLLGAAKALCGSEEGIAVILGTGSNSCYFDGKSVVKNVMSLGYILGDEGSGCYMGKQLLQDYFNEEMPSDVRDLLFKETGITAEIAFDNIYRKVRPNKYMASFSAWIGNHYKEYEYLSSLVYGSLEEFFERHISKYPQRSSVPMHVVGSVGYAYQEELQLLAKRYECTLGKVIKSPIDGLIAS